MASGGVVVASPLAETYLGCMAKADWSALRAWYAPDVRLDVTLPEWRFSLRGVDAILGWLNEAVQGFAGGIEVREAREFESDAFVAIVWEGHAVQKLDDGGTRPVGFRQTDIFALRNGKGVDHVVHCTGIWDEAVFARIAAEAPHAPSLEEHP